MKKQMKLVLALAALLLAPGLKAQTAGSIGAGVIVGRPIGLTGKYWMSSTRAVDAGIGISDGNAAFYADFVWHAWDILPQFEQGKLGLYVGAGPRFEFRNEEGQESRFGVRAVGGVDYWIQNRPIELFLEAGPFFRMMPGTNVDLDGGLGVRFYFGK